MKIRKRTKPEAAIKWFCLNIFILHRLRNNFLQLLPISLDSASWELHKCPYSQEHSLSFSARFANFEWNITSDWLSQSDVLNSKPYGYIQHRMVKPIKSCVTLKCF